jgi:hypothetical protein
MRSEEDCARQTMTATVGALRDELQAKDATFAEKMAEVEACVNELRRQKFWYLRLRWKRFASLSHHRREKE